MHNIYYLGLSGEHRCPLGYLFHRCGVIEVDSSRYYPKTRYCHIYLMTCDSELVRETKEVIVGLFHLYWYECCPRLGCHI